MAIVLLVSLVCHIISAVTAVSVVCPPASAAVYLTGSSPSPPHLHAYFTPHLRCAVPWACHGWRSLLRTLRVPTQKAGLDRYVPVDSPIRWPTAHMAMTRSPAPSTFCGCLPGVSFGHHSVCLHVTRTATWLVLFCKQHNGVVGIACEMANTDCAHA